MITNLIIFRNYLLIILSQPIFLAIISLSSPPRYFTLSALSLRSLSALFSSRSLRFLQIFPCYLFSGESRERSRGGERSEGRRMLTCAWRRCRRESRRRTTAWRCRWEPPEVGLILLSSSSWRRGRDCRDGDEVAEMTTRLQRRFLGEIFWPKTERIWVFFIKSRLAP